MAGELMLINPRRRKRRKSTTHRRRRRHNPVAANPRRRRRRVTRRRRNPWAGHRRAHAAAARKGWRRGHHRRRHYRRNPRRGMGGLVNAVLMPSVTAAAGALGIDLLLGYVPLPDTMKTGPMKYLVKGAAAIGVGMILEKMKLVKPHTAQLFTTGALTVAVYDAGKDAINRFMPTVGARMAGLGYYESPAELQALGYASAGYTGMDDDMGSLGMQYEMDGLGADIEEFEL
jgi:hypothetical protein